jgi:hypothetical protein
MQLIMPLNSSEKTLMHSYLDRVMRIIERVPSSSKPRPPQIVLATMADTADQGLAGDGSSGADGADGSSGGDDDDGDGDGDPDRRRSHRPSTRPRHTTSPLPYRRSYCGASSNLYPPPRSRHRPRGRRRDLMSFFLMLCLLALVLLFAERGHDVQVQLALVGAVAHCVRRFIGR